MVKIVFRDKDRKRQYGIVDEKSRRMFYWTDWKWSKKETDYDYNATLFMSDGGDNATLKFLKSIDQTKAELPISLEDSDLESDTEETGLYTNDACSVPKCEWHQINFKTDSGEEGVLSFQENTDPWFQGDIYEFSQNEWVSELEFDMPDFKKEFTWQDSVEKQKSDWLQYRAFHEEEWKELSGEDIKKFFDESVGVLIKQHESALKRAENKKKAAENKKKADLAKIDGFAEKLVNEKVRKPFIDYVNKHKIKDDFNLGELVDLLNAAGNNV